MSVAISVCNKMYFDFCAKMEDFVDHMILPVSGIWNVPFINTAILFKGEWLQTRGGQGGLPSFSSQEFEQDMAFCKWMRDHVSQNTS